MISLSSPRFLILAEPETFRIQLNNTAFHSKLLNKFYKKGEMNLAFSLKPHQTYIGHLKVI